MRVGVEVRSLVSPEVRGLTRYTVNLLRGLSQRDDIELVLFCRDPPDPNHLQGISGTLVSGVTSRDFLWYDRWLARELRSRDVQVLHAPADRGLPLRSPCPAIVTVHDSYERAHWKSLFPTLKQRLWYWRHEFANGRASAIITVSDTTRRQLLQFGFPAERVHTIYPAAGPEFSPVAGVDDASIIKSCGIRAPYFLCVSAYDARKNLDTLVSAFDAARLPDHQLVIVADRRGTHREHQARWSTLPAFARLVTLEIAPAWLPALYRKAEACINPSRWESFGFQLVEAMACGTPVVSSNAKALPEIAGDAAEYFDPDRPLELAKLLQRLVHDRSRLDDLRNAGRRRIQRFSWADTVERTVELYRRASAA